MPGSTGRKRKSSGTNNLVDFVKDFNHEYLASVEAQESDKRTWRTDVLAFDTAREARITKKETLAANLDQKFYELEVERTIKLGQHNYRLAYVGIVYGHTYEVMFSSTLPFALFGIQACRLLGWFAM